MGILIYVITLRLWDFQRLPPISSTESPLTLEKSSIQQILLPVVSVCFRWFNISVGCKAVSGISTTFVEQLEMKEMWLHICKAKMWRSKLKAKHGVKSQLVGYRYFQLGTVNYKLGIITIYSQDIINTVIVRAERQAVIPSGPPEKYQLEPSLDGTRYPP